MSFKHISFSLVILSLVVIDQPMHSMQRSIGRQALPWVRQASPTASSFAYQPYGSEMISKDGRTMSRPGMTGQVLVPGHGTTSWARQHQFDQDMAYAARQSAEQQQDEWAKEEKKRKFYNAGSSFYDIGSAAAQVGLLAYTLKSLVETIPFEIREKIIQDMQVPGTLSYKIAPILAEHRWEELGALIDDQLGRYLESALPLGLAIEFEEKMQIPDMIKTGKDLYEFMKILAVSFVISDYTHNKNGRIYIQYFVHRWMPKFPGTEYKSTDEDLKNAAKVANPEMLSFYLRNRDKQMPSFLLRINVDWSISRILDKAEYETLSKDEKKCIQILVNTGKKSQFWSGARLKYWIMAKQALDPEHDQMLLAKLEKYYGNPEVEVVETLEAESLPKEPKDE